MKNVLLDTILGTVLLLALSACSQDELAEQGNTLPDGEYPLQIGSVSITAESSTEPWSEERPQTRVAENDNGTGSVWQLDGSEMIGVRLGNETTTYTLNADKTLTTDQQLYWTSTDPATVTAWYPTDETVGLSDQSEGLAYMLKAEVPGATYNNEIALDFKHQLAKVRVVLSGTQASLAQSVEVYGCTTCTNNEGAPVAGDTQGWLKMKHTTYTDGTECWEANVVPGTITLDNFVRINGQTATVNDGFPTTLSAGEMYTLNLTVGQPITEITPGNVPTISDDGHYRISGTLEEAVTITGGKPTIYLENAQISVSGGNAIDITGGASPTIHVMGEGNSVSSSDGAGIYVAENATVTITGSNRSDVLTVTGNEGSSGIGGYVIDDSNYQSANSGNINIENVTLYAYSSSPSHMETVSPGIGSTGSATCQSITIDNAAVYAYGCGGTSWSAPAIGNGMDWMGNTASSTPTVTISNNSEVHAHRGERIGRSFADYIGRAGTLASPYSDVIATVDASSVVYKYTGYGNTPDQ